METKIDQNGVDLNFGGYIMLFNTYKHSFLTALVAVLALAGSAGCWGMEEKQETPKTLKAIQELKTKVKKRIDEYEDKILVYKTNPDNIAHDPNQVNREKSQKIIKDLCKLEWRERSPFINFFHTRPSAYFKSDLEEGDIWSRIKNFGKNIGKTLGFFLGCSLIQNWLVPTIETGKVKTVLHGATILSCCAGLASGIRAVKALYEPVKTSEPAQKLETLQSQWKKIEKTDVQSFKPAV